MTNDQGEKPSKWGWDGCQNELLSCRSNGWTVPKPQICKSPDIGITDRLEHSCHPVEPAFYSVSRLPWLFQNCGEVLTIFGGKGPLCYCRKARRMLPVALLPAAKLSVQPIHWPNGVE